MEDTARVRAIETAADLAALEDLYQANVDTVYSYAAARLGASGGEEVAAEVFHAAVVAFRDGKGSNVTPAWLMAVTKNKVIDRWRKAERRKAKAHLLGTPESTGWPERWSASDNREQVMEALDRLAPDQRVLLILRHVDAMPVREIAEATGRSVGATESRLARARRAFREHYERLEGRNHG